MARGGLPSIQIFSNAQADDADLDAELASYSAFSKHREGASDAEWGSVPRKQELNCPAGRRRTRLSLSAYDLELSLEYARLLKVVQLVLTLLRTRKISTMRDVYYMDCRLFQSQTKSDRSIDLLARCFNTPRYGLNIVSFSRVSCVFLCLCVCRSVSPFCVCKCAHTHPPTNVKTHVNTHITPHPHPNMHAFIRAHTRIGHPLWRDPAQGEGWPVDALQL